MVQVPIDDMVAAALASAPGKIHIRAREAHRDIRLAPGSMNFHAGAGCPQAYDRVRGRRPGTLADFREISQLIDDFGQSSALRSVRQQLDAYDGVSQQLDRNLSSRPIDWDHARATLTQAT